MDMVCITIRAKSVEDLKNGEFRVSLPAREVSEEQRKVLRELFPNFCDQVYDVLAKESLLTAIVPPGDEAPIQESGNLGIKEVVTRAVNNGEPGYMSRPKK